MDFSTLLNTVLEHLEGLGVKCTAAAGEPATEEALAAAEAAMKIRLPTEFREFYRDIGNGVTLFWESDSSDPTKPWGGFQVPALSALVEMYTGWRGLVLYSPEQAEKYGFPYTKDPALAKRTAARMWHWLPVFEHGNGDTICLDLGAPGCPVVFDQHDWMDGGSGANGHSLAPTWPAFLAGWARVCFQEPAHLDWPPCFRPGGGVNWEDEHFLSPFRVPGSAGPAA